MIKEISRYLRYDGDVRRCTLTGEICAEHAKSDCRSCLVPIYMWMLENGVRE